MTGKLGRSVLFAVTLIWLIAQASTAQVTTADVVGRVTDSTGATIKGAGVTIENLGTHDTRSAQAGGVSEILWTV